MGGFKWSLDWDTNPLRRGGQAAADAVDTAIDEFSKLATDADRATGKAGDGLGRDVKDGSTDARHALGELEDAFRDTARRAAEQTARTGKALGDDVRDGTRKAGDAVGSFKEEAAQNFGEVASSFSGDMSQAADGVQGILGGLSTSLPGPVGLISGILGGIGGAMLANFQQRKADLEAEVASMYDDLKESQSQFLSESYLGATVDTIIGDPKKFQQAKDVATASGVSLAYVLRGMAGDTAAAAVVTDKLSEATAGAKAKFDAAYASGTYMAQASVDLTDAEEKALDAQGKWNGTLGETDTALGKAREKADAYKGALEAGRESAAAAAQTTTDFAHNVSNLPSAATVRLSVDDSEVRRWAANPVTINAVARVGRPQAT